jgi:hypothetical protein
MRSKANREKSKLKFWDRTGFDKQEIKFYGFVYRLHNNCLKECEIKALGYRLRDENSWLKYCYDPLVYITQENIDRHFRNTLWEKDDYPFNCIEVWVSDPFACPYTGHGAVRNNAWVIKKPGYYRVNIKLEPKGRSNTMRTRYKMKHYKGMPFFNKWNDRCHNNYVSRAFHVVLKYYKEVREGILAEKQAIKDRKEETYNRLKNKRVMQNVIARQKERERLNHVRGIVPTKETTAFFQALAIGSVISRNDSGI